MVRSLIILLFIFYPLYVFGEQVEASLEQTTLEADSIIYDKNNDFFTATGNVIIIDGTKILYADKVTYDKNKDTVQAFGNIRLHEPEEGEIFGDEMELKNNFKQGVINHFKARLIDNSLVISDNGKRISENVFELENATYTPCKYDETKHQRPEWVLKAKKVKLDRGDQSIKYRNVFFAYQGVPIFYSPYISHPMPNADRKSGFLKPSYGVSSKIGTMINIPYYFNLAPEKDFTLTTMLTSLQGPVFIGEYRHLLSGGKYNLGGSITYPKDFRRENGNKIEGHKFRGHIEGKGNFDIGKYWYTGFDFKRASDDTYLRTYDFSDENYLVSTLYVDRVYNKNITSIETYSFQGLLPEDVPGEIPLILPVINSHYETQRSNIGSYFSFDNDLMLLYRDLGVQSRRLSSSVRWRLPHRFRSGHEVAFSASLRGDVYDVDNVPNPRYPTSSEQFLNGPTTRLIPEIELDLGFPVARKTENGLIVIEPMLSGVYSPPGLNNRKIPNEDSLDFELSDDNLFNHNRFAGFDRVETGARLNYGLNSTYYNDHYGSYNLMVGESYRFNRSKEFMKGTGLDTHLSDFVGRLAIKPSEKLDLAYKFRIDNENYAVNRSELYLALFLNKFKFAGTYASIHDHFAIDGMEFKRREEVAGEISYDLNQHWTFGLKGRRNLASGGHMIKSGGKIDYHSDCVHIIFTYEKDHTRDENFHSREVYLLSIDFKNLLSLSTNI